MALPDPLLDEINATTLREIYPRVVEDEFFLDTPLLAYARANCLVPFQGGESMSFTFLYAPLIGGSYAKGASFNIDKVQTLSGCVFYPKYYYTSVVEQLEDILVVNKGPLAVYSLLDIDLRNAMNTITAINAIALARHGQGAGAGIVGNRPNDINGWEEAFDDGITPQWDGSVFAAYGNQARNGVITNKMNSTPYWAGTSGGATGPITYNILEETYQDCSIGRSEPDLGVGNKAVYAYIKERMQVQQGFRQEKDPYFGVTGFRFNNAMILKDDYFPSLKYGQSDPVLGSWLTGSITNPLTGTPNGNFPNSTQAPNLTVGEVFNWFNTKKFLLRVTDNEEFGYGFTGLVRAQDSTRVVGQVKAMINAEFTAPRLNKTIYGIGS
jgi:hypothetical protein